MFITSKCDSFITDIIGQGGKVLKSKGNKILNVQFEKNDLNMEMFSTGKHDWTTLFTSGLKHKSESRENFLTCRSILV